MIYFAATSFAEVRQRLTATESDSVVWDGFLGVGDPVLEPLPRMAFEKLRHITRGQGAAGTAEQRDAFVEWVRTAIAPRNIAGLADASRNHLYPVDLDLLIDRHALLGLTRDQLVAGLPALRGMSPEPAFG